MVTDRSILEQTLKSSGSVRQIPAAPITLGTPCEPSTDRTPAEADGNVECPAFVSQRSLSLPSLTDKHTTISQSHLLIFMKENGISVQPFGRTYITGREHERAGTSRTN